jgi:hypothetical protein
MKLKSTIFILIAMSIMNVHAATKTITNKDFIVHYEEYTENYAKASLKILNIVKMNVVKMGFTFPKKIELHIVKSNKNLIYVRGDKPNLITWEFKSMHDFLAPQKSGYNNVYGLCHEMGHLCMGNITPLYYKWMTVDYGEGWANYFGSLMIEKVYKNLGVQAWPDQHDYHKSRGLQAFLKNIKANTLSKEKDYYYCSLFWYNLSSRIGKNNVHNFFYTIKMSDINITNSDIKFLSLLMQYKLDSNFIEDFKKNKDCLLITKKI